MRHANRFVLYGDSLSHVVWAQFACFNIRFKKVLHEPSKCFLLRLPLFCTIAPKPMSAIIWRRLWLMRESQAVRERVLSDEVIKEMRTIDVANTKQLAHLLAVWLAVVRKGRLTSE